MKKHSGGILIYVSELCSSTVSVWKAAEDGTRLWLKFADLGKPKPLFLCITYVPPQNSPYAEKPCMTVLLMKLPRLKAHQVPLFWPGT